MTLNSSTSSNAGSSPTVLADLVFKYGAATLSALHDLSMLRARFHLCQPHPSSSSLVNQQGPLERMALDHSCLLSLYWVDLSTLE